MKTDDGSGALWILVGIAILVAVCWIATVWLSLNQARTGLCLEIGGHYHEGKCWRSVETKVVPWGEKR